VSFAEEEGQRVVVVVVVVVVVPKLPARGRSCSSHKEAASFLAETGVERPPAAAAAAAATPSYAWLLNTFQLGTGVLGPVLLLAIIPLFTRKPCDEGGGGHVPASIHPSSSLSCCCLFPRASHPLAASVLSPEPENQHSKPTLHWIPRTILHLLLQSKLLFRTHLSPAHGQTTTAESKNTNQAQALVKTKKEKKNSSTKRALPLLQLQHRQFAFSIRNHPLLIINSLTTSTSKPRGNPHDSTRIQA
jgi:hypothetical protein